MTKTRIYINKKRDFIMRRNLTMIVTLLLFMLIAIPASAESVTQKEAKKLAQQFFNQAYGESVSPVKYVYNGRQLTTGRLFSPFYVYNQQRGGFVIISAENKTFPILAYSLKENFNPDKLTESEKGWLKSYAMDIEMIRYDSRYPSDAIKAWQDYPHYIVDLLDAKYVATDPRIAVAESQSVLEDILSVHDDTLDGNYSAYYTPGQWGEVIDRELAANQSVAIGYVDFEKHLYPGVIYGKKGDYYKIAFENRNEWMMRLAAAEYFGERLVAALDNPPYRVPEPEEEQPFAYYESILKANNLEAAAIEEHNMQMLEEPSIKPAGGGHFDILLPENARLAMIYNIDGALISKKSFRGNPMAHIDIEAEPRGFYIAVIYGESGEPYSFKLYR